MPPLASPPDLRSRPSDARFETTGWSNVLRAAAPDGPATRPALAALCEAYWYPLYAYLRRTGKSAADAEDAVQGFFVWLLERDVVRYADPARGRFRSFLVTSLKQFLARRHAHDTAAKRCPPRPVLSLDLTAGEGLYARELTDAATPDRVFEYSWAVAVLRRAVDRLREEYDATGRGDRFRAMEGSLTGSPEACACGGANRLGMSAGAYRVAVHRFRQRFRDHLRAEVGGTLDAGEDVDAELRSLLEALKSGGRA